MPELVRDRKQEQTTRGGRCVSSWRPCESLWTGLRELRDQGTLASLDSALTHLQRAGRCSVVSANDLGSLAHRIPLYPIISQESQGLLEIPPPFSFPLVVNEKS